MRVVRHVQIVAGRYEGRVMTFVKNLLFGSTEVTMDGSGDRLMMHQAFGEWYATRSIPKGDVVELSSITIAKTEMEAYEAGCASLWPI